MKRILPILAALALLSACATVSTDPAVQKQADFDRACTFANGAVPIAEPLVPMVTLKLGADVGLAATSLIATVKAACGAPLDINNANAIIQRVYDAAGQIIALVLQAQKT